MAEEIAQVSLLESMEEAGYRSSVITTYNCYFPFYEEVVLRRMRASGCIHNILFVDADRCAEAYSKPETRPRRAGQDYVLIPVKVGGAFHPKVILRVGKTKGLLHIGSHNMTYSGFGLNDEITNVFTYNNDSDDTNCVSFASIYDYLSQFIPGGLVDLKEAYEGVRNGVRWMKGNSDEKEIERIIIAAETTGANLWSKVVPYLPQNITKAYIEGPFFDPKMECVKRVMKEASLGSVVVGVDPRTTKIDATEAGRISNVRYVNTADVVKIKRRRENIRHYMHAKIMWFKSGKQELLVTGSANPSVAAYLADSARRNVEVIVADRRTGVADDLGILELLEAPEMGAKEWKEVSDHQKAVELPVKETNEKIWVAVAVEDGFLVNEPVPKVIFRVFDENGIDIGEAKADDLKGMKIKAGENVAQVARYLLSESEKHRYCVVVHHAEQISQGYGSESRQAIRHALDAIEQDPLKLEELMQLTEKVIFESEDIVTPSALKKLGKIERNDIEQSAPITLAVDAGTHLETLRHKGLAGGDIGVLLDALLHRLGLGLTDAAREKTQKQESEMENNEGAEGEECALKPEYERVASLCRSKVRRLIKLVEKQLARGKSDKRARQCIVQLTAVLAVVRALKNAEGREEWKEYREKLVSEDDEEWLFRMAAEFVSWEDDCILKRALDENAGKWFKEMHECISILSWLAWERSLDLRRISDRRDRFSDDGEEDEEDKYYLTQVFVSIGMWLHMSVEAQIALKGSIKHYSRHTKGYLNWIEQHLEIFGRYSKVVLNMNLYTKPCGNPRPGDLAVLGVGFNPRVRVIQKVDQYIYVYDPEAKNFERAFLASKIIDVPWLGA